MQKQARLVFTHGLALALGVCVLTAGALSQDSTPKPSPTATLPGQTATLLPDGRWLLLGGFGAEGPTDAVAVRDGQSVTRLATAPGYARAWHSATVASDGSVIIIGGLGSNGQAVAAVERFDPEDGTFSTLDVGGLTPRAHHTATLLTDGEILIVGGISSSGETLGTAELLNPKSGTVTPVAGALATPRSGHTTALQANGDVLIRGGVNAHGNKVRTNELYDPKLQRFSPVKDNGSAGSNATAPAVSGSIPAAGAKNVPVNADVSIRFSQPVDVTTVNPDTITLSGPDGNVAAKVVAAEAGRLAFANPNSPLMPGVTYTVTVDGVAGIDGAPAPPTSFSFTTVSATLSGSVSMVGAPSAGATIPWASDPEAWVPTAADFADGDWNTHRPPSPWQSLPAYRAPGGVTALSGQVLTLDGMPLAGVTLQIGKQWVKTDPSGRFLLKGLASGSGVLLINGASANNNGRTYGIFQVGVNLAPRLTTVLPFTIWMPLLDTAHAVTIPSPTTSAMVIGNPLMPGLQLHIPAGTTITDINGKVVRTITITPVPLDRPPFPLPLGVQVPIYFTIQPGGSQLWAGKDTWAWAQLYYPNLGHFAAGTSFDFWNYAADKSGWYVYGHGSVSKDGSEVVPDPGVGIWTFSGAMVGGPGMAPPSPNPPPSDPLGPPDPCPDCTCPSAAAGDPVDCSTGLFFESHTDMSLRDVVPIKFIRTYRTADTRSRPFGIGATDNYEIFLVGNAFPYTYQDLILPDGARVYYPRTSSGTGYTDAVYQNSSAPGRFYGSTIAWNGNGWNLTLKDGTVYTFPDSYNVTNPAQAALVSITDRYGNKLTITRDSNFNITQITSPNERWIQLQHDSSNRITQIQDDMGRTVSYSYDTCAAGMLCSVTDSGGGVTSYTYDSGDRMLTMTDPRGNTVFTNQYDTAGRVSLQTLADGTSTYQFGYTLDSNGNVSQATVTDPNGVTDQKNFTEFYDAGSSNYTGFLTSNVRAVGKTEQQTMSYTRDPSTDVVTSKTDQLGRETSYTYDALGNMLTITRLAGTPQAVTTIYTYTSTFNELASVTDPLSHTWTLGYDSRGDLTSITDPLTHQIALGYNLMGELTSATDPMNDIVQFGYVNGDLTQITDPLGNPTRLFIDNAGRLVSTLDALGNVTQLTYDNLDRITRILDANSGTTSFSYDANGNLLSLTDANNNKTSYTYDARNRRITRTDALSKSDSYVYDANRNLTQYTDRNGTVDVFTYDGLNRRTFAGFGKNGSNYQDTIGYTFDGGNRLTQAVDALAGTIARTYDGLDRLTEEQTPQGDVTYGYDNASRRTAMTVAGQSAVGYIWDNANRLTGITQGSSSVGLVYDNASRRTTLTLPNGVTVAYTYDSDSRVNGLTYTAGSTQLGNLSYSYDADGRRTSKGGSLTAVTLPSAVSGNTFNADNGMTGFNGSTLGYDANGNLTSDGTNTYTWDARHHLTAISGAATASFAYDALGRRASKTINGTVTQFLYDGLNPVQELAAGNPPASVTANQLTGLGIDEYFTRTDSSGTMAFLRDALGSTVGLVNSAGGIATSYTYEPFGNTTVSGGDTNPYQFTGRENDGTDLYFYRARYYSPTFQRFVSQDLIDFAGGVNLYAYTLNNPITLRDLLGLCGGTPMPTPDTEPNPTPTPNLNPTPTPAPTPTQWQPGFLYCMGLMAMGNPAPFVGFPAGVIGCYAGNPQGCVQAAEQGAVLGGMGVVCYGVTSGSSGQ